MKVLLALITAILFWSSAFVGIRYALVSYHPGSLAFLRYVVASITLLFFFVQEKNPAKLRWRDVPSVFLLGLLGIGIYNIALNFSEVTLNAAVASFIISQTPVISVLLAVFFLKEYVGLKTWLGIGISVLGVVIIAVGQRHDFDFQYGLAFAVIATLCAGLYTVFQKPILKRISSIQFVCYAIWFGTLAMAVYLPQTIHDVAHAPISVTLTVVYLGVFPGALGFLLWSYALKHYTATKVASFFYIIPFITTFMGWIFIGEIPTVLTLAGGFLALVGAYFVNKRRRVRAAA